MKAIFADTSYYAALLNPADALHGMTKAWSLKYRGRVVVTEYVLLELGSYLSRCPHRALFLQLVAEMQRDAQTEIISASPSLLRRGMSLFAGRPDKEWSLTDCLSFVVMKQRRIAEALTADHHFQQAGFRALLLDGGS
ncbi:MAG: type II toxin-antitoxin system VapC family toxin [Planctomycetales bacterium]